MSATLLNPTVLVNTYNAEQKRSLLLALVLDVLSTSKGAPVFVVNADNKTLALLLPARDATTEYHGGGNTLSYLLELQRRALTPDQSITWPEMRSHLAVELGVENPN